jgi:hypothetical protein
MSEKKEIGKEIKNCKKVTKELLFSLISKRLKIEIEGFGGDVYVKAMSGHERRIFHQMMADDKEKDVNGAPITMIPVLIALCTVDADGENIFGITDADIKEIDKKLSSTVQNKIFGAAAKLNGLTDTSVDESVKN